MRRYDVDWLRAIALALLIVYHVSMTFQPWAILLAFIQNKDHFEALWPVMSMINVWRIPILFLISGMGVRFAMERRNGKQLLKDRTLRILVPLVFGSLAICPISAWFSMVFYGQPPAWAPNTGHLWFLGNIYLYVLALLPVLVYLRNRPDHPVIRWLARGMEKPWLLPLAALPLMLEAWLLDPQIFTLYVNTLHGLAMGFVCFLTGFILVSIGKPFWRAAEQIRYASLAVAFALYLGRVHFFPSFGEMNPVQAFESMAWMLGLLGFGSRYLNRPSRALGWCSRAVYPVYIVHLPVQYGLSLLLVPLALAAPAKWLLLLAGTFAVSLLIYRFLISPFKWLRPLFGMKF
jgi:glucan biosynthesis protein C